MAGSTDEVRDGLRAAGVTEHGMERAVLLYGYFFDAFEHEDWDEIEKTYGGGDLTVGLAVIAAYRMVQVEELEKERRHA